MKTAKRPYDASSRRESAEETRRRILDASRAMFCEKGYAGTSMQVIAQAAGISLDTVYASVGKKPALFALLVESAISGADVAIPAEERDYVQAIRSEPDVKRKLAIYAAALRSIQARLAPLFRVLQEAATQDAGLSALWNSIAERRARNMKLLAKDLAETGKLRRDLGLDTVADYPRITDALSQRGYADADIAKILGENWLRVYGEVTGG